VHQVGNQYIDKAILVVLHLLGNSPVSKFSVLMFQNSQACPFFDGLLNNISCLNKPWRWDRQSVPKRRHIKFRRRGIAQKKEYNIHNMTKVWNQESHLFSHSLVSSPLPCIHHSITVTTYSQGHWHHSNKHQCMSIQGVRGGMCQTSGGCSLC